VLCLAYYGEIITFYAVSYESYGKISMTSSKIMKPIENKPILTCQFSCRMDNPLPPVRRKLHSKTQAFTK